MFDTWNKYLQNNWYLLSEATEEGWQQAVIDIGVLVNDLRFRAVRGKGYQGDIALDTIRITEGPCFEPEMNDTMDNDTCPDPSEEMMKMKMKMDMMMQQPPIIYYPFFQDPGRMQPMPPPMPKKEDEEEEEEEEEDPSKSEECQVQERKQNFICNIALLKWIFIFLYLLNIYSQKPIKVCYLTSWANSEIATKRGW